ncbi:hypothetical protein [Zhenhengia sp.]|uniref:hypothetical protein n=1 Tax=Zhenhengia sp. TaxID=2944208 RepID=UPI00307AED93
MKFYLDSILKGFKPVNSEVVLKGVSRQTPNFVIVDIDQDGMPEILFTYQVNGEKYIGILKRENMQWYLYDVSLEKDQKALGLGNLVNVLNGVNLTLEDVGKAVTMQDLVGNNDQAFVSYVNDILNHGMVMQQIAGEETVAQANEPMVQQVIQPALPPSTPLEEEPLVSAGGFIPSNTLNTPVSGTQTNVGGVANMPNNMNAGSMTGEQIIQQTGPLPPPENINTPQAQAALNQNVTTPIMSINEAGLNANNMQGVMTGEQIIQQTGPLPSPGNVNTPQAQAALNQNFITPIMSTMGIGEQMDETAFEEEVAGGEMPEVKVYNISNDMGELGLNIASDKEVINFAQADVTGDGIPDNIYLVGNRPRPEMPGYFEDVGLRVVSDGRVYEIDFPYGNGYGPVLFVGDLTHDGIADILVNIFASGGGGFLTSYAYTFVNDQPTLLIDSKTFNDLQRGTVIYQDNYRVRIETLRPPRVYTIDISDRGPEYLNQIYNPDGTLIRPTEGTLLGLITLHTVDFDVNGEYNLSAVQRAIGLSNLDTLGLLETYFAWRPAISRFQPFAQYFSILGQPPR